MQKVLCEAIVVIWLEDIANNSTSTYSVADIVICDL